MAAGSRPTTVDVRRAGGLDAARDELDAARTLLLNLHRGGLAACVHLMRAASLLGWVAGSLSDDSVLEGRPTALADPAALSLPGLDRRRSEILRRHLPVVAEHAGLEPARPNRPGRAVEASARVVHDLLERELRHLRGASRPRRTVRVLWVAAAVALCGAAVMIAMGWGKNDSRRAARPVHRSEAPPSRPIEVALADLATPRAAGTPWDVPGAIRIPPRPGTMTVRLGERMFAPEIEISADNNDRYRVELLLGDEVVARLDAGPTPNRGGLAVYRLSVPAAAIARGYDLIRVVVLEGDGSYSIGHLLLLPPSVGATGPGGAAASDGPS